MNQQRHFLLPCGAEYGVRHFLQLLLNKVAEKAFQEKKTYDTKWCYNGKQRAKNKVIASATRQTVPKWLGISVKSLNVSDVGIGKTIKINLQLCHYHGEHFDFVLRRSQRNCG